MRSMDCMVASLRQGLVERKLDVAGGRIDVKQARYSGCDASGADFSFEAPRPNSRANQEKRNMPVVVVRASVRRSLPRFARQAIGIEHPQHIAASLRMKGMLQSLA